MENRHTVYDLPQMQSLSLNSKILMSRQRIRDWYEHYDGDVYISVSGGKDSQVLAHLVHQDYPDVPCVFINTGLEYDSVRKKGIELSSGVLLPAMNFVQVITKFGYPIISKGVSKVVKDARSAILKGNCEDSYAVQQLNGTNINKKSGELSTYNIHQYKFLLDAPFRISNECCNIMKKQPAYKFSKKTKKQVIFGTMASESRYRRQQWIAHGCNAFDISNPRSAPISFWTEQDILSYIERENLVLADVYGKVKKNDSHKLLFDINKKDTYHLTGVKRTGCVFCMFGINFDKDRFLKLKEIEPKKYDYVMRGGKFDEEGMWIPENGLGYKFVIDWLNENGNLDIKY